MTAIDFSALVLAPCMDAFAIPVTVYPIVSQVDVPSYTSRGIWTAKPVLIDTGTGVPHLTQQQTLGIKLDEYPVMPSKDDSNTAFIQVGMLWSSADSPAG